VLHLQVHERRVGRHVRVHMRHDPDRPDHHQEDDEHAERQRAGYRFASKKQMWYFAGIA
jgi:hypothetical protein